MEFTVEDFKEYMKEKELDKHCHLDLSKLYASKELKITGSPSYNDLYLPDQAL